MTANVDLTQFLRKPAEQKKSTPLDLTQFKRPAESQSKEPRGILQKGSRLAGQFALGTAENALLPYEIGVSPLASKEAQNVQYRESVAEDIENLMNQKLAGQWSEKDQEMLTHLENQLKDPEESGKFAQTLNIGVRGLAEKATGLDLHPEGILEKAANWIGFLKNPKNAFELIQTGVKPKDVIKAIIPGQKTIRGLSAGTALEMAEEGKFGPLGTLASAIVGDVIGLGPKAVVNVARNPKKFAAQVVNLLTMNNTRRQVANQLAADFNQAGLKIDAGTLTQSPLIQMMQARLSQSGLTGTALDNFRKDLSGQISKEYQSIANEIGSMAFENNHQAAEAVKSALKVEEKALGLPKPIETESRSLEGRVSTQPSVDYQRNLMENISPTPFANDAQAGYEIKQTAQDIKEPIKKDFDRRWTEFKEQVSEIPNMQTPELIENLNTFLNDHRGSLLLGESSAEHRVYKSAQRLLDSLEERTKIGFNTSISELMKTKRTLGDIANWEFGGSNFESAYKKLVSDIDNQIQISLQRANPELLESFRELNADYTNYKRTFENKNLKSVFEPRNLNFNDIHNQFLTNPDKLVSLEHVLSQSPEGTQVLNKMKRDFANKELNKTNLTDRDYRNLAHTLGPQFEGPLQQFVRERQHALENPLPRARRGQPLGVNVPIPQQQASIPLTGHKASETSVKRAAENVRRKMYDYLKSKDADKILKEMDTIEGIRKLRRALNLTEEGREVFKDLARYKMSEIIDKKMQDSVSEQVKLGKFSHLLDTTKNKSIIKELVGNEAFEKLLLLQKNSGGLAQSAEKFFNASKSGTTLTDMSLVGAAATGVLTGNAFYAIPAIAKIGGSYVLSVLFSDPIFLKELQNAILTNNPVKFNSYLKKMKPSVQKALEEFNKRNTLGANNLEIPNPANEQTE